MSGPEAARELRECIIKLCKDLKPEAVALVDALAPPDFILNSVLGASNGDVSIGYFEIISMVSRIPNLIRLFRAGLQKPSSISLQQSLSLIHI